MFPVAKAKLPLQEISNYWSREIQPPASRIELLEHLEKAWWLGEIQGDGSRHDLLKRMFKSMYRRNDLGVVFVVGEDVGEPPPVKKLPDGSILVDVRHRIFLPSEDASAWDERSCEEAFRTLAQTSSTESYPEMTPSLAFIELTFEEFTGWLVMRGFAKPKFWRPLPLTDQLKRSKRGRPAEYNWIGVKDRLADYVSRHGSVQTWPELLQKCSDFASELHPEQKTPDDKTIRDAIKRYALDIAAGRVTGK
jgi:hypothetical protein